jgi:hypothetical protein
MDVVGYLVTMPITDKGLIPRRLWVQPAGKFAAKCRFPEYTGTHFDNPTIKKILSAVGLLPTLGKPVPTEAPAKPSEVEGDSESPDSSEVESKAKAEVTTETQATETETK